MLASEDLCRQDQRGPARTPPPPAHSFAPPRYAEERNHRAGLTSRRRPRARGVPGCTRLHSTALLMPRCTLVSRLDWSTSHHAARACMSAGQHDSCRMEHLEGRVPLCVVALTFRVGLVQVSAESRQRSDTVHVPVLRRLRGRSVSGMLADPVASCRIMGCLLASAPGRLGLPHSRWWRPVQRQRHKAAGQRQRVRPQQRCTVPSPRSAPASCRRSRLA